MMTPQDKLNVINIIKNHKNVEDLIKLNEKYGDNWKTEPLNEMRVFAIHFIALSGQVESVKYFVKNDPNCITYRDRDGETPIIWAKRKKHQDIVDFLLLQHLDESVQYDNEGYHLIHIAAENNDLDIVENLLENNKNLLNITNGYGKTSLHLAAEQGHHLIIKFLLSKGAIISRVNHPGHTHHNKTPLQLACSTQNNTAIFYLAIHAVSPHPFNDLLNISPQLNTATEIELPRNNTIIPVDNLEDSEIATLILNYNPSSTKDIIAYIRLSLPPSTNNNSNESDILPPQPIITNQHRNNYFSQILRINPNYMTVYTPDDESKKGANGYVRKFANESNDSIAVKAPLYSKKTNHNNEIPKETTFYQILYREDSPVYGAYQFDSVGGMFASEKRMIMPYFKGETLESFFSKPRNLRELIQIIYHTAVELMRIHANNIIHHDIKLDNIMVDYANGEYKIHFIDFGLSSFISEQRITHPKTLNQTTHYPPELFSDTPSYYYATPSIDIYSFAYMIQLIERHLRQLKLFEFAPCIKTFVNNSLIASPQGRPSLNLFVHDLNNILNPKLRKRSYYNCNTNNSNAQRKDPINENTTNKNTKKPEKRGRNKIFHSINDSNQTTEAYSLMTRNK